MDRVKGWSKRVAATVAAAMLLAACGGGQDASGDRIDAALVASLSPQEAQAAADAVNEFGFALHRAVAEPGTNTVTSPLSASVLLGMVAAGAGGTTAAQMVEVLGLQDARDTRYAALLADLTADSDVTLSMANSLWAAQDYPFAEDYLDFVQDTFGATLDDVDLGAQESADRIDGWVEDRTEGLIDQVAEDLGLPNPDAVLVLLNTVYFLGEWTTTFDEDHTRDAPFHLDDGREIPVPTMHRTDPELATATGDGFTLLRLPYGQDERFGMEILLPDDDITLEQLLERLDRDLWQTARDALATAPWSELALPRFELEWDAELNDALQDLGIVDAFTQADFTPMSPENPQLDTVVQKTYLWVDEQGTEAAAVTGGVMVETSGPPALRVDRPFAFTVSDRETSTVLFLGTVHDPRG